MSRPTWTLQSRIWYCGSKNI